MARPQKQTVDYFPHFANSGKTMFILESKFGNDGYAFWFKLLEILATTEGHYFRVENGIDWEFLLAKTKVSTETAVEILNTLANLEAIDKELWAEKIIWVQKFVDNLAEVYRKRKVSAPLRPTKDSFRDGNHASDDITDDINPQSIVEESKVDKSKVEESKEKENDSDTDPIDLQDAVSINQESYKQVIDYFLSKAFMMMASPKDIQIAEKLVKEIPLEIIYLGIDTAFQRHKPKHEKDKIRSLSYCEPVVYDVWTNSKTKTDGNIPSEKYNKNVQKGLELLKKAEEEENNDNGGKTVWDV